MNRQRFAVLIVAIIGIIATFLPWYRIMEVGTISGMSSSGWFTILMFIVTLILAVRKNLHEDMTMGVSWCITICSLLASFAVLWMTTRVGVRVYGHLMAYLSFGTRFSLIGTIAPPYAFTPRILTLLPFVPRLKGASTL